MVSEKFDPKTEHAQVVFVSQVRDIPLQPPPKVPPPIPAPEVRQLATYLNPSSSNVNLLHTLKYQNLTEVYVQYNNWMQCVNSVLDIIYKNLRSFA